MSLIIISSYMLCLCLFYISTFHHTTRSLILYLLSYFLCSGGNSFVFHVSHANDHVLNFTTKFLLAFLHCNPAECYKGTYPVRMLCSLILSVLDCLQEVYLAAVPPSSIFVYCLCFSAFSTHPTVGISLSSEGYWFVLLV